jgi:hypothetical protein
MANLSQTAANVALGGQTTKTETVQAGESVTQGMPVYLANNGKWFQSDANVVAAATATTGIAVSPASTDGFFSVVRTAGQDVNIGATLTVGELYVVSATKGAIAPIGDLIAADYVVILGIARTTVLLRTIFNATGVAKA